MRDDFDERYKKGSPFVTPPPVNDMEIRIREMTERRMDAVQVVRKELVLAALKGGTIPMHVEQQMHSIDLIAITLTGAGPVSRSDVEAMVRAEVQKVMETLRARGNR